MLGRCVDDLHGQCGRGAGRIDKALHLPLIGMIGQLCRFDEFIWCFQAFLEALVAGHGVVLAEAGAAQK